MKKFYRNLLIYMLIFKYSIYKIQEFEQRYPAFMSNNTPNLGY